MTTRQIDNFFWLPCCCCWNQRLTVNSNCKPTGCLLEIRVIIVHYVGMYVTNNYFTAIVLTANFFFVCAPCGREPIATLYGQTVRHRPATVQLCWRSPFRTHTKTQLFSHHDLSRSQVIKISASRCEMKPLATTSL